MRTENIPNCIKSISLRIRKVQWTPNEINTKKTIGTCKNAEKTLKADRAEGTWNAHTWRHETAEFSPRNLWNSKVVTEEKMSTHSFTLMNEGEVHLQTHEGWEQLLPPLQDAEGRWRAKDRTRKEPRQKWQLHEIKPPLYSGNTDCRKGKLW